MNDIADYRYEIYQNPNQGDAHRALFLCSGGILRSATAAHWAAEHKGWNTRSAGIYSVSVPPVCGVLVKWAERIYCMEDKHAEHIKLYHGAEAYAKCTVLHIPDNFCYRAPQLIEHIAFALGAGA